MALPRFALPVSQVGSRLILWAVLALSAISSSGEPSALGTQASRSAGASTDSDQGYEQAPPGFAPATASAFPQQEQAHHLAQLGIPGWHAAGYRGKGIKIAVLDSGFRGYRDYLGKALPANVTCRSFRRDGNLEARNSQHGILCAEVLHALAPDAALYFANWEPQHPSQFLEAVAWARQCGARIISCSLIMPSWSDGDGGGPVEEKLARLVGPGTLPGDVLFFASAGNTALRHWAGVYRPGASGFHEWQPGRRENHIYPWAGEQISVELYGRRKDAFQLEVLDEPDGDTWRPLRSATVVKFTPRPGHVYQLRVRQKSGSPGQFHVVVLGGDLEFATPHGSVPCPADCPGVVAVGAVAENGVRLPYSSCGPCAAALKPDLVAPVPFPSVCRSRPFSGTSAAAPQAAGMAALCWCRHPDWTPRKVRGILCQAAHDLGVPGPDWETGFGLIAMPLDAALPSGHAPVLFSSR